MSILPEQDLKYLVALANFPKFGPVRLKKLQNYFPSAEEAFRAPLPDLLAAGIDERTAGEFFAFRPTVKPDLLMEKLIKEEVKVLALSDENYPRLLKEIYDPPALLYYKGALEDSDQLSLAVVGTRKYSPYGKLVAERLVRELAQNSLTIVSGLALGIDALAHTAALEAGGRTVAVLGSGLDRQNIYPSQNRYLAEKILAVGGCLLSEFPLGTPALRHHFPQRNRIVSGLSLGVLVIEAGEKSGSLITARFALEQGREVFAVPGHILSPVSAGTNEIIKRGARLVTAGRDIFETLDLALATDFLNNRKTLPETEEEKRVVAFLGAEPKQVDELKRETGLDINILNSTLTIMEMKGMIKNLGNLTYILL